MNAGKFCRLFGMNWHPHAKMSQQRYDWLRGITRRGHIELHKGASKFWIDPTTPARGPAAHPPSPLPAPETPASQPGEFLSSRRPLPFDYENRCRRSQHLPDLTRAEYEAQVQRSRQADARVAQAALAPPSPQDFALRRPLPFAFENRYRRSQNLLQLSLPEYEARLQKSREAQARIASALDPHIAQVYAVEARAAQAAASSRNPSPPYNPARDPARRLPPPPPAASLTGCAAGSPEPPTVTAPHASSGTNSAADPHPDPERPASRGRTPVFFGSKRLLFPTLEEENEYRLRTNTGAFTRQQYDQCLEWQYDHPFSPHPPTPPHPPAPDDSAESNDAGNVANDSTSAENSGAVAARNSHPPAGSNESAVAKGSAATDHSNQSASAGPPAKPSSSSRRHSRAPAPLVDPPAPAIGTHQRKCSICRHPKRASIERDFLDWYSPTEIQERYGLPGVRSLYRHARIFGLLERRRQNELGILENVLEESGSVRPTAGSVVSAFRLYHQILDKRAIPPRHRPSPARKPPAPRPSNRHWLKNLILG